MARKIDGKYFGTEIEQKWWKRYLKNKMLSRGNGTLAYNEHAISILRLLTKTPIVIELEDFRFQTWKMACWPMGSRKTNY